MSLRLKRIVLKFTNSLKERFLLFKSRKTLKKEKKNKIDELKLQVDLLSSVVHDQSMIIVSLAKVQSEVVSSIKNMEENYHSDNYLLLKIPIKSDDIVN